MDEVEKFISQWNGPEEYIEVRTSGSTGVPKLIAAKKTRMLSSAKMTCDFLSLKKGDTALLCMSLDYIAGKMMVVRAIERGLDLLSVKPSNHPLVDIDSHIVFAAMIPSQVYSSLQVPSEREKLLCIDNLIIGGGAVSLSLEKEIKKFPNNVWSTYGMTETLSHIALRRLSGPMADSLYTPLSGITVSLSKENTLVINAPNLCDETLYTNDIAQLFGNRFKIIGRRDNVICSGGIKLQIEQIEETIRPFVKGNFCITKAKDEKFGEVAVLLLEIPQNTDEAFSRLKNYSVPKHTFVVDSIPMTPTGKVDRHAAISLATHKTPFRI